MKVCDTCHYPYEGDGCPNPACLANPSLSENAREAMAERYAKADAERVERERRLDLWCRSVGGQFG